MSKTNNFQLDYLNPKQLTSRDVLADERRFTTIDNNLYALFKIFGNGILLLESNEFPLYVDVFVDSNATKKITISSGRAFVNYKSMNYTTSTEIDLPTQVGLITSQKYYIYLKDTNETAQTELGEFIFSSEKLELSNLYVGIGAVQINYSTGVTEFFDDSDNGRELLNIKKIFMSFINNHKHTGGLGNPKKIDLSSDVTGQLQPDQITFVDASKINKGQMSEFVSPQVNHDKLKNAGNLSHSQIDSALLSFRDDLNLEVIASTNQLKTLGNLIRTTSESAYFESGSSYYPSGPIATIDSGMMNVKVYVPNVSSDSHVVGFSGSISTALSIPNLDTGVVSPYFTTISTSDMAQIDRNANNVCVNVSGPGISNTQKIFVLQDINPKDKIDSKGENGYFGGFVAGLKYTSNSGACHLVHFLKGTSGTPYAVNEEFSAYRLTIPDKYNTSDVYGTSGVQIACMLTNLTDFAPTNIISDNNYNFVLYSGEFTGPRLLSIFHNGYLPVKTPTSFFSNTGPLGAVKSFYFETSSGSSALLFNNGNIIANMGADNYSMSSLGGGKFTKYNSKVILSEFSSTSLKITEMGATGPVQNVIVTTSGKNITHSCLDTFTDENSYRVFYIDNSRLFVATENGSSELGYFNNVQDLHVKDDRIYILTNSNNSSVLYHAYHGGYPSVFNEVTLSASASGAKIDSFTDASSQRFISVVSNNNLHVYDLYGKQIYNYMPGLEGESGPTVQYIYSQFDLGDATVDLKYG